MNYGEHRVLSAAVDSAGLDKGDIPAPLKRALQDATSASAEVCDRHLTHRFSSNSPRSLREETSNAQT